MAAIKEDTCSLEIFETIHPKRSLHCARCNEPLDNPHSLPCLHAFCQQCMLSLVYDSQGSSSENDYTIVCSDCKDSVTIGMSSGLSFQGLLDTTYLFRCLTCGKETNSIFRCKCCPKLLCLRCYRTHSYTSCLENLNVTKKLKTCPKHHKEFKYFCLKCEDLACVCCMTDQNKDCDHQYVLITDAEKELRNEVETLLHNAEEIIEYSYSTISSLEETVTNDQYRYNTAKNELELYFKSIVEFSKKSYNDALKDLNAIYSLKETNFKSMSQEIEVFIKKIDDSCKCAKQLLVKSEGTVLPNSGAIPEPVTDVNNSLQIENPTIIQNDAIEILETIAEDVLIDFRQKMIINQQFLTTPFIRKSGQDSDAGNLKGVKRKTTTKKASTKSIREKIELPGQYRYKALPVSSTFKIGSMGSSDSMFSSPHGFCLGANEEVIVADTNNHRVQIFDKNGEFKLKFGETGKEDGYLWLPRKVAIFPSDGRIIVSDTGTERTRLQMFSNVGVYMKRILFFDVGIVSSMGVTEEEHIVIVDSVQPTVFVIDEFGKVIRLFDCSTYIQEPSDMAIDGSELFICDFKAHCIGVFNENGVFQRYIVDNESTFYPNGIAISKSGYIFVCDSHNNQLHFTCFTREGAFKASYLCPRLKMSRCCGLRINSNGFLITLARNNHYMLFVDIKSTNLIKGD